MESLSVMDAPVLAVDAVTRTFDKGAFVAVSDVSMDVKAGEIHALIGPNGAGKTTLAKMISTILNPTSGHISVNGYDTAQSPAKARGGLGLVIGGDLGFYPRATARQNLRFFGDVAGVRTKDLNKEVDKALAAVDLADRSNSKVNTFSRGMMQRLHIARALLGRPSLLVMDEPTSGLDPDIAVTIRSLVRTLAENGHAILLTSHTMSEIEDLSSRVSVIGAGRLYMTGNVHDVVARSGVVAATSATMWPSQRGIVDTLRTMPAVKEVQEIVRGATWSITVLWNGPMSPAQAQDKVRALFEALGQEIPVDLVSRPATLEEAYLALANELKR